MKSASEFTEEEFKNLWRVMQDIEETFTKGRRNSDVVNYCLSKFVDNPQWEPEEYHKTIKEIHFYDVWDEDGTVRYCFENYGKLSWESIKQLIVDVEYSAQL